MVIASNGGVPRQRHIVLKPSSATNTNVRSDNTMVSDSNVIVEFGSRINHSGVSDYRRHGANPGRF